MPENERTYKSETLTPVALRLEPVDRNHQDPEDQLPHEQMHRKLTFTPELIFRLTERIKKL